MILFYLISKKRMKEEKDQWEWVRVRRLDIVSDFSSFTTFSNIECDRTLAHYTKAQAHRRRQTLLERDRERKNSNSKHTDLINKIELIFVDIYTTNAYRLYKVSVKSLSISSVDSFTKHAAATAAAVVTVLLIRIQPGRFVCVRIRIKLW